MAQLEHIEAIEKRLWSAADLLRTGSNYASNEYFMPVMGLIFLQEKAQFETLVSLSDDKDRAKAVVDAMESIEADYETLKGVLPKAEYGDLDNEVLGTLLRTLNPDELKKATGDIFGRIYEYFGSSAESVGKKPS